MSMVQNFSYVLLDSLLITMLNILFSHPLNRSQNKPENYYNKKATQYFSESQKIVTLRYFLYIFKTVYVYTRMVANVAKESIVTAIYLVIWTIICWLPQPINQLNLFNF